MVAAASPDTAYPAVGAVLLGWGAGAITGTLVTDRHVLTAASGVTQSAPPTTFVLGPSVAAPAMVVPVAAVAVHPGFDAESASHDAAVLTLGQSVTVAPLPLGEPHPVTAGATCTIVGFGTTVVNANDAGVRRSGQLVVDTVGPAHLIAVDAESAPMPGDTGAPLLHPTAGTPHVVAMAIDGDATSSRFVRIVHEADFIAEALGWLPGMPSSPGAAIRVSPVAPRAGEPVQFHLDLAPGATVNWAFGDGVSTGAGEHPHVEHVYPAANSWVVRAWVTGTEDDAEVAHLVHELEALPGQPAQCSPMFSWSPSAAVAGESITFDASSTFDPAGQVRRYRWSWGDGSSPTTADDPVAQHQFVDAGQREVTLTVFSAWSEPRSHTESITVEPPG